MGAITGALIAMENIEGTIAEREKTHGDFSDTSKADQRLKEDLRAWRPAWARMHEYQRTALDMICQKLARIVTGDPMEVDHWKDIEGYARMTRMRLEGEQLGEQPKPGVPHASTIWRKRGDAEEASCVECGAYQFHGHKATCSYYLEPWKPEAVNHPAHYGGMDNPFETIKVLEAWLTPEQFVGFLRGNALKYLSRAGKKDPSRIDFDLAKAEFYTKAEIAFVRKQEEK